MTFTDTYETALAVCARYGLETVAIWPLPEPDGQLKVWVGVFFSPKSGRFGWASLLPREHPAWPTETLCGCGAVDEILREVARPLVFPRHYRRAGA
jgi:hypothetical protein